MSPRRERFWLGAYRLLLRAWPAELRREFGEDMLLLFRDRLRETWTVRRPLTRCRFTWRTLRDVIGAGLRERWEKAFGTTTLREEAARRRNRRIPPEERPRDAWFDTLRLDIRFGLRMLRRNPLFTAVAILCFGIGIGANATIFSFLFGLMANPLQLEEPRTLISCELCSITQGWTTSATYPDFLN